ncbi:hypothetical protein AB6A40_011533, partial [Gnathostoma spinigerum]
IALLDTGSQRSFITSKMAESLHLEPKCKEVISIATFASKRARTIDSMLVEFDVLLEDNSTTKIEANVMPMLTRELKNLSICVPRPGSKDLMEEMQVTPDILIGADQYWQFLTTENPKRVGEKLFIVPTKIGNLISGKVMKVSTDSKVLGICFFNEEATVCDGQGPRREVQSLEDFWNLETTGIRDSPIVKDDHKALQLFEESIQRVQNRYEARWPWKEGNWNLATNYGLSLGRLRTLLKRLVSSNLFEQYKRVIDDQEEMGVIEKIDPQKMTGTRVSYIPHQAVITPSKITTKIRIVNDASAKTGKTEHSLNECLLRGPVILPNICGMLLRFHIYPIVLVADIEKAFLQVDLREEDRDTTRFLWVKNKEEGVASDNLIFYRFKRKAFGVISSPFLLAAVIRHHFDEFVKLVEDPVERGWTQKVLDEVKDNIYVDNFIISCENEKDAENKYHLLKTVFSSASMNLIEWGSNKNELNSIFSKKDQMKENCINIFGLQWDRGKDTLSVNLRCDSGEGVRGVCNGWTKRTILSYIASAFDPLGLLTPILVPAKILFQELWKSGYSWDDTLSHNATTFKGAEHSLRKILRVTKWRSELDDYCTDRDIKWSYVTSHAPWKGGFYERLIG